jgi:hypothetical protein
MILETTAQDNRRRTTCLSIAEVSPGLLQSSLY